MSSLSLGKQGKLHDVQDDLESIFWVALYIIILYFPFDRKDAIHIIDTVINQYSFHPNGVPFGGHGTKIFIEEATLKPGDEYSIILPDTVSPPLLEWIGMYRKMLLGWHTYHKALARWTGGRSQGEDAEGDDDDDADAADVALPSIGHGVLIVFPGSHHWRPHRPHFFFIVCDGLPL